MTTVLTIISHTPVWVFPLIVAVLWLSGRSLRERTVPLRSLFIFPLVLLALSVGKALGTRAEPAMALLVWLGSAIAGGAIGWIVAGSPRAIDPVSGHITVPGSVVPLIVCVAIIAWRYAFGYLFGRYPELAADRSYALALIGGAALLGGIMLGRLCRHGLWYWRRAGTRGVS